MKYNIAENAGYRGNIRTLLKTVGLKDPQITDIFRDFDEGNQRRKARILADINAPFNPKLHVVVYEPDEHWATGIEKVSHSGGFYKSKYLKYKTKYLNLKYGGGATQSVELPPFREPLFPTFQQVDAASKAGWNFDHCPEVNCDFWKRGETASPETIVETDPDSDFKGAFNISLPDGYFYGHVENGHFSGEDQGGNHRGE